MSASQLPRRPLGRTGVDVSAIGIGGYHLGLAASDDEAERIVHAALDAGIDFLDNCWDYHDGRSEERMGRALLGGRRQQAFLMTKLDGRTRKAALAQLEQSLRRLGTDCVDLVQVHEVIRMNDPGRVFAEDGAIHGLMEARKAGKLRFIGFTGHKDPAIHLHMLDVAEEHGFRFDTVQMPLNVLDAHYRSFEHGVLPRLVAEGIGVLGMKSMAAGKIVDGGAATAEECLRYAMSLGTSCVITGCETMERLDQAVRVARDFHPMDEGEKRELLSRTKPFATAGRLERFKTTGEHDGTEQNPRWLTGARV
jgi:aryl-alcohol dehydrogenase-like predicted oxidoreductase